MTDLELANYYLFKYEDSFISFDGSTEIGRELNLIWNEIYETRQEIKKCSDLEQIKIINDKVANLTNNFLKEYRNNYEHNVQYLVNILTNNVVYNSEVNSWLEDNINTFRKTAETEFGKLSKNIENYTTNKRKQDNFFTKEQYEELREKSFELIQKYNLGSIVLDSSDYLKSKNFLEKLNSGLEKVIERTGISYEDIGHDKTLSFVSPRPSCINYYSASFNNDTNKISLTPYSIEKPETLLHEWAHSLDFRVGNRIKPNCFASTIEEAVIDDGSADYKAFRAIKDLTQGFMSRSSNKIKQLKEKNLEEGSSKFLNLILGSEYYNSNKEVWKNLHTEETIRNINNYLIEPKNQKYIEELEKTLINNGLLTDEVKVKLREPTKEIMEVKVFFDNVNKNILGSESIYHLISHFSNLVRNFEHKDLVKAFGGGGNGSDKDYFTQPTEMFARYFESQFFHNEVMPKITEIITSTKLIYKIGVDKVFTENKEGFFSTVLNKTSNIINSQIGNESYIYSKTDKPTEKDIEAAKKIEESIINENSGSVPDGFEKKDGVLTKKHISDEEWIKLYEENIKKENETNSLKYQVIDKVKSLIGNFRSTKEQENKRKP